MKIIVGTDFTENAAAAARAAAALARRWDDTLILAHAADESLGEYYPSDLRKTLDAATRDQLAGEAARIARTGLHVEPHLLSGTPDEALSRLADAEGCRMIVVSSLGHRPGEWLLGSVAERTAERSPAPTLVVRSSEPFQEWAFGDKPLRIFVAFDFTELAEMALHWVKHLASVGPCDVVIGYIDWPLSESTRLGVGWPPLQHHNPPEVQAILKRELSERAAKLLGHVPVRVRSEPSMGRPDALLVEMACEENADLIVTGAHQRRGAGRLLHPSISRALLRHAPMSVLCVPVSSEEPVPRQSAQIGRVLAAVDLCEHGDRAVPFAYGIVRPGGAVRLIHVLAPFKIPNPLIGGKPHPDQPTANDHAHDEAAARERLSGMIPADAATRNIATEVTTIESHDVARAIRQAAERFGADVICVGAHNRSGLMQTVLGSVAQAVMTHSERPVLVVRDQAP